MRTDLLPATATAQAGIHKRLQPNATANDELADIVEYFEIPVTALACALRTSRATVNSWLAPRGSNHYRPMRSAWLIVVWHHLFRPDERLFECARPQRRVNGTPRSYPWPKQT